MSTFFPLRWVYYSASDIRQSVSWKLNPDSNRGYFRHVLWLYTLYNNIVPCQLFYCGSLSLHSCPENARVWWCHSRLWVMLRIFSVLSWAEEMACWWYGTSTLAKRSVSWVTSIDFRTSQALNQNIRNILKVLQFYPPREQKAPKKKGFGRSATFFFRVWHVNNRKIW